MKIWAAAVSGFWLAAMTPAAAPVGIDTLAWMSGQWANEREGRWTEESWTAPRGGVMLGYSRSGRGVRLREFEFLRIAAGTDGILTYIAQPGGGAPVAFRLVEQAATSATFENPDHDYPQRIHYRRDGDKLTATISAIDGTKDARWTLRRR